MGLLLIILLLMFFPAGVYAQPEATSLTNANPNEQIAIAWIRKMAAAKSSLSYRGVYTYMRGSQLDIVRISHRYDGKRFREKSHHLNGPPREILRDADKVECIHGDPGAALNHPLTPGPFSRRFNDNLISSTGLYQVTMAGHDRVADRAAVRLLIDPRHNDRYGWQLWLDQQTGLLLQSNLVDRGRVLETFYFSTIEIDILITDEELTASLGDNVLAHGLVNVPGTPKNKVNAAKWRPEWLPEGFEPIAVADQSRTQVFSDGLASFSIFLDSQSVSTKGELVTHLGGTVVLSRQLTMPAGDQRITIVGELPESTARKIAESIRPTL